MSDLEANLRGKEELVEGLREENLNLKQANADLSLSEMQHKELLLAIKEQIEKKTKEYEAMAGELAQTREKLSESQTSLVLSKD